MKIQEFNGESSDDYLLAPREPITAAAVNQVEAPILSALIVNYNAGNLLSEAVAALLDSPLPLEVLVSDNGSLDTSLKTLEAHHGNDPRLRIQRNQANLGFAAGHNRVLPWARAPYLLFLNPDCIVGLDTLPRLIDFMEATPQVGMVGCIVRNPDGSEQKASRRRIPDPWIGLVRFLHLDRLWPSLTAGKHLNLNNQPLPESPLAVEAISGSLMLVRRQALVEVGPLDMGYFLHCEDLDWFMRFRRAGWHIYLVPGVEARHHQGACSVNSPVSVEWYKHKGMARFFRKFQFHEYPPLFSIIVLLGIWVHFGAFLLVQGWHRLWALGGRG